MNLVSNLFPEVVGQWLGLTLLLLHVVWKNFDPVCSNHQQLMYI
jgi:hypothetical protein